MYGQADRDALIRWRTLRSLRRLIMVVGACLLAWGMDLDFSGGANQWVIRSEAAERAPQSVLGQRATQATTPQLTIEPYVRPELAIKMHELRPVILAAARRHNPAELSGMSDEAFAEVMAAMLYNEHNGWLEDEIEPLRMLTPVYEQLQVHANQQGVGSDFSIWPSNVRPSVALEILRGQVPLPEPTRMMTMTIEVRGSQISPDEYDSEEALLAAISQELCQDTLAVEYLAANLERGVYRAQYENVPVTWRTLAAWHNGGVVQPDQMRANGWVRDYARRTSAYLPMARRLIAGEHPSDAGQPVQAAR
jgi:hypothetical protein